MIWLGLLLFALLALTALSYIRAARRPSAAPPPISDQPVEAGAAVLLLHHRRAGREEIARDWTPARRTRAEGVEGLRTYLHLAQAPRLNIIYVLLQLSRSWPFAALNALRQGLPVLAPRRANPAHDYDHAELFYFDDLSTAQAFAAGEAQDWLTGAAPAMTGGALHILRATRAMAGVEEGGRIANFYLLRAREEIGRAAMIDYWLTDHRPYVLRQQPILGYGAYDQLVAPDQRAEWDGAALLTFADFPDLMRGLIDPRTQPANFGLVHDEARFLDFARSSLMLGEVVARWRREETT